MIKACNYVIVFCSIFMFLAIAMEEEIDTAASDFKKYMHLRQTQMRYGSLAVEQEKYPIVLEMRKEIENGSFICCHTNNENCYCDSRVCCIKACAHTLGAQNCLAMGIRYLLAYCCCGCIAAWCCINCSNTSAKDNPVAPTDNICAITTKRNIECFAYARYLDEKNNLETNPKL